MNLDCVPMVFLHLRNNKGEEGENNVVSPPKNRPSLRESIQQQTALRCKGQEVIDRSWEGVIMSVLCGYSARHTFEFPDCRQVNVSFSVVSSSMVQVIMTGDNNHVQKVVLPYSRGNQYSEIYPSFFV